MSTNFLQTNEFVISIEKLPDVVLTSQKVDLPSVSVAQVTRSSPFNSIHELGDKLEYSELSITFMLQESLNNYLEIFKWMKSITFPERFEQYGSDKLFSDMSVVLKSSHKNPSHRFDFYNCFPTSLSNISLDVASDSIDYPECTVSFSYDYFEIAQNV